MSEFNEILTFEDGPVQYENTGGGHIKMKQHPYPYSVKQEEFDFLKNLMRFLKIENLNYSYRQ
jgi:hypothetical protein